MFPELGQGGLVEGVGDCPPPTSDFGLPSDFGPRVSDFQPSGRTTFASLIAWLARSVLPIGRCRSPTCILAGRRPKQVPTCVSY